MSAATKPGSGDDSQKVAGKDSGIERKEKEEAARQARARREERNGADVGRAALEHIKKAGLPESGKLIVRSINDYKFRVNYYVEHSIVWTRCMILKADRTVEMPLTQ